jgi:TetR/AcrR family transcriptional regulator
VSRAPGRDTRKQILDEAEREFARAGYDGAHLEAIASPIGVRKTALYHHFPSKAALYEAVLLRMLDDFESTVGVATEASPTPLAKLEAIIAATNELMAGHPNYAKLLLRVFVDRPSDLRAVEIGARLTSMIGARLAVFKQGMADGVFNPQSARHLFLSMVGASVLYYASADLSSFVVGVDDVHEPKAAAWRLKEIRRFLRGAIVKPPQA